MTDATRMLKRRESAVPVALVDAVNTASEPLLGLSYAGG